jgi:hypothetical protein
VTTPEASAATSPSGWASKLPADMTVEELREAKARVQEATDAAQLDLGWKAQANTALNSEILSRFSMTTVPGYVDPRALPEYPSENVKKSF